MDWDIENLSSAIKIYLLVGGKSFFYKSRLDKGICFNLDLMDKESTFLDFHTFTRSKSINTNFLQYQGVIKCIKTLMKKNEMIDNLDKNMTGPIFPKVVQLIFKLKKGSQTFIKF